MQVIGDGIFRGYVPINHHWINDDPATYYDASNSVDTRGDFRRVRRSLFSAFDLEGYQVVRGQFMTARTECPSITVTNNKISFNVQCMRKFYDVPHIQLLLHPSERKIAIRPCKEGDVHSIRWRPDSEKALVQKSINCQHFGNALFQIMDWNPDYLYRIRGTWVARGSDQIIVFNLTNAVPAAFLERDPEDGSETSQRRRVDLCPEEWNDSFGEDFYEYSLNNSFYFLAPRSDWKVHEPSRLAPGSFDQPNMSDTELEQSVINLRKRVGSRHGE